MKKRIVITGGHLTPALAVIDELKEKGYWEIHFIGRKYASEREKTPSIESQVILDKGIWFYPLVAGRFPRLLNRYTFWSSLKLPIGFFQAFYYLIKIKPNVILSFGGYLSVPVVFWGWLLGIPSLTHEQTTVKGLATKFNSIFAKKIAVSWPGTEKYFSTNKVVLTGNPIRKDYFKINQKIWQTLDFSVGFPLIFITGGNQGSHLINATVGSVLPELVKLGNVFHQCGHLEAAKDFEMLQAAREKLPEYLRSRYHAKKYLSGEEMGTILNKCSLVVCRSGANTLTEIAALGKPALLIPHPWNYQDEQGKNAQLFANIGVAEILLQKNLNDKSLMDCLKLMLKNLKDYQKNASKAKRLVRLDAAKRIAKEIEKVA